MIAETLLALTVASASPNVEKSVAILYAQDANGGMSMRCTATAILRDGADTIYLTAAHCVSTDDADTRKQKVTEEPLFLSADDRDAKAYVRATIREVGVEKRGYDYAFLASPLALPVIPLGDERTEADHVRILNVAAPSGIGKVYSFGHVALRFIDRPLITEESHINWAGAMLVHVDNVAGGSSGSAIVSQDTGHVIGILVGTHGNLTIAIPASRLATTDKENILFPVKK